MNKQMIAADPTLPGLLPDAEALALARSFQWIVEGTEEMLDRLPTELEREVLRRRFADLAETMRPIEARDGDRAVAAEVIAGLLVGYGYARGDPASRQTVTVYVKHLEMVPLFAIRAACEDVKAGRVFDVDARTGNRRPLNPDKEPSTIRLRAVAEKHAERVRVEQHRFDRILRARRAMPPMPTEAERARVSELLRGLSARMAMASAGEDLARRERLARRAEEERALVEREFLAEYERLGLKPQRAGGMLISPQLAEILGIARVARDEQ